MAENLRNPNVILLPEKVEHQCNRIGLKCGIRPQHLPASSLPYVSFRSSRNEVNWLGHSHILAALTFQVCRKAIC